MKWKQILLVVAVSAISAIGSVWIYSKVAGKHTFTGQATDGKLPANYAGFFDKGTGGTELPDFTRAANTAVQAVVHIKTKIPAKKVSNSLPRSRGNSMDDFFNDFFGDLGPSIIPEQRASGSGVLISDDGYIVTNNHVISDGNSGVADEITVTLHNKKSFKAKVIGRDPSSDLAVLKIDGTSLPYMIYGNSDEAQLGQWVLAIGYPLTLETTVTAGIISAKGRSIGINGQQSRTPVESFIQTDAAVNQGNSGGALITTAGQLIGINSAILAPNGTYAGYSFAIPVNIVKKVVADLIEFGDVKRGYMGISYNPDDASNIESVKRAGLKDGNGVYVQAVPNDGSAFKAGLRKGDVVTKINNNPVYSGSEMSGQIASFKPGDKVPVTYVRAGKEATVQITLSGQVSKVDISSAEIIGDKLGVELANVDEKTATKLGITGGVVVKKIDKQGPFGKTRMEEGFIITSINDMEVKNTDELGAALTRVGGGKVRFEGVYQGFDGVYTYQIDLSTE